MSETKTVARVTSSRRRVSKLGAAVAARVGVLQAGYAADVPSATAALARLRKAVGVPLGDATSAWDETLELLSSVGLKPQGDRPSPEEAAVHAALTLFGLHQQSQRDRHAHQPAVGFGSAVRRLADARGEGGAPNDGVLRRFHALGTSVTFGEALQHTRGLVTQFRGEGISFDYGHFTDDLVDFQDPNRAASVRLTWGRDFYRQTRSPSPEGDSQ